MSNTGTSSFSCCLRTLVITTAAVGCLGLAGCSGLLSGQASMKPTAQASPTALSASAAPAALGSTKPQAETYVDPMVSTNRNSNRPSKPRLMPAQTASAQPTADVRPAESLVEAPAQQNSLANAIQQPTAVQAGHNSIFAIANAKVAEAQGVPAYAPVRNINPMAGSVFSARTGANAATPAQADTGNKNGLW